MGRLKRLALLLIAAALAIVALAASWAAAAQPARGHALVLRVEGVIDPVNARYVSRGVKKAERDGSRLLIVRMDTPGGLDTSMRKIVQALLNAQVPTAVYVSPAGARAASAGVFIAAAAHFAVMAPGTNMGAAHPVSIGGDLPEDVADKVTNDAAAYVRSIAIARDRNPEWYEQAVRKSVSATATEAVELRVIDFIAADLGDLLRQLHGRSVTIGGQAVTLDTQSLALRTMGMPFLERLLHFVADPNIALILLSIGGLLLVSEVFHPTIGAGVTGAMLLALGFMALGTLPINWVGVGLLLLGIALLVAEVFVAGFGVLGALGIVSFVIGALIMFSPFSGLSPAQPDLEVSLWVLAVMAGMVALMFLGLFPAALRIRRLPVVTESGRIVGQRGVATADLAPRGVVQVASEEWTATTVDSQAVRAGEEVEVVAVQGLTLIVQKVQKTGKE